MSNIEAISMEMISASKVAEQIAAHMLQAENCDLPTLEALLYSKGFNFGIKNPDTKKSVLQSAIQGNSLQMVEAVYKAQSKNGLADISVEDIMSVAVDKESKEVLEFLVKRADKNIIKKCLVKMARPWMTPKTAWALMHLESAIDMNKKLNLFDYINDDKKEKNALFICAVRCSAVNRKWIESMLKANFAKYASPESRWQNSELHSQESALVCALQQNDFVLAKEILAAGYVINKPYEPSEIETAILNKVGAKGVEFLIESGWYPFPQCDFNGGYMEIRHEADVIKSLAPTVGWDSHHMSTVVKYDWYLLMAIKQKDYETAELLVRYGNSVERLTNHVGPEEASLVEAWLLKKANGHAIKVSTKSARQAL